MNITMETFGKSERLCSFKVINALFENGNVFYNSLFKVVWSAGPEDLPAPAQVAVSVSKRGFKLAVTRNLIKRRMREAYRKNKQVLYEHLYANNSKLVFVIILRGNVVPDYLTIEKSVKGVIKKLIEEDGRPKTEDRRPKTEDGRPKTEDRRPKTEVRSEE
jgi:ribonuclease P protein component